MSQNNLLSLRHMTVGQEGEIVKIAGGRFMKERLAARGVRPGKKLKKVSGAMMRGPIVFEIEKIQIAIGQIMARHIIVKII